MVCFAIHVPRQRRKIMIIKIKIKIALLLCLSFMLWVGSASGDLNETGNGTVNDTDAIDDNITKELFFDAYAGETDNIPPFGGAIGPEHVLYKLKIAFGNMDETFTHNNSERLYKQVLAAQHRIAEARAAFEEGNEEAAGLALGHYNDKTNEMYTTVGEPDIDATCLMHVMQIMHRHNQTLQNMIQQQNSEGRNVIGLEKALGNCFRLEENFNLHIENKVNNMAGQANEKGQNPEIKVSDGSLDGNEVSPDGSDGNEGSSDGLDGNDGSSGGSGGNDGSSGGSDGGEGSSDGSGGNEGSSDGSGGTKGNGKSSHNN